MAGPERPGDGRFPGAVPALKHLNKSYAAIGAALGISAWALSLVWPTTGEGAPALVYLSDRYAAATTVAERTALATAAEVLIATEAGTDQGTRSLLPQLLPGTKKTRLPYQNTAS